MFKLYASIGHWSEVDRTNEEQDVINTIADYLHDDIDMRFIVVKRENNSDTVVKAINNIADYVDYVDDFSHRKRIENINKRKVLKK